MSWLRAWGIKEEVFWQEDWGGEWGGDNLEKLRKLNEKYYKPYGAILGRAPKGRKGYQGRVERSHKTDDEEFYIPLLSSINSERKLLQYAAKWIYWYNVKRSHFGKGMDGRSPFEKLKDLGYNLPEEFALLPPIILDDVSTFWAVRGGNNLLTPYICYYETIDFTLPGFQRTSTYILKLLSIKHYRDPLATKYKFPTLNYPKNCPLSGKHGLARIENITGFNRLIQLSAAQCGKLINIAELSSTLGISKQTIEKYLFLLENTFIITLLLPYFTNKRKEITKMPKIYMQDTGLRNSVLGDFTRLNSRADRGEIVENVVLSQFFKNKSPLANIFFWRSLSKAEVDFVVKSNFLIPVEVKYRSFRNPIISRSMRSFLQRYKPPYAFVITKDFIASEKYGDVWVYFIPCWLVG